MWIQNDLLPKKLTNLRAEAMPATLDDAGEGELAAMEGDVLLHPPARTRRLPENLAAFPQAGVGARGGLQLADHMDNLRKEGLIKADFGNSRME